MTVPDAGLPLDLFTIHAQWGPRATITEQAGQLLASLLRLTGDADPRITVWFPAGDDRFGYTTTGAGYRPDHVLKLVSDIADGDPPTIRIELETFDVDGTGAPTSGLDFTAGSVDRFEPNHVTWALHGAGPQVLASPVAAQSLLRAVIALTDGDWAAISSSDIDGWQPAAPDGPTVGWSTYIAHRLLPGPPLSMSGVQVEPVHRGCLYTVAPRPELTPAATVAALAEAVRHRGAPDEL